jgi:putative ABC transport system permease protein
MQIGNRKKHPGYPSVPSRVLIYIAWRNITAKRLRSSITILGVTIGIGSICFLVSFGLGLQTLVTKEVVGNKSIKAIDISTQNSRIVKLDQGTIDKVRGLPHVESLGISYSQSGTISLDKSKLDTVIYGVDVPYQKMVSPTIIAGRLFSTNDHDVAYVNTAMLNAIGIRNPQQIIGKKIAASIVSQVPDDKGNVTSKRINRDAQVVGVIESGTGGELYLQASVFGESGITQFSQVKLITDSVEAIPALRKQIESFGLQTASPIDTIDQVNQIFRYFTLILLGFGAIGMIIAILGMFNTLTISLLERTGEIGLLKVLGGRRRDMRSLFFLEAMILSIMGAVIGIVLAIGAGYVINYLMNQFALNRGTSDTISLFLTPWWLVLLLIGFMMLVGMAVVIVPARRAERINPVDALSHE